MTLLEKIKLGKENTYISIYEAPYNLTISAERCAWIYGKKPCFGEVISRFWRLYDTPLSQTDNCALSMREEEDERRRFIRYPIVIAATDLPIKSFVFGGIWIDNVEPKGKNEKKRVAHIHIKLLRNYRHLAYPFFKEFLKTIDKKYDFIYTAWGPRNSEDNPTNFLQNWGFNVTETSGGSQAILELKNVKHL